MIFQIKDKRYKAIESIISKGDLFVKWVGGEYKGFKATDFDVKLSSELWNEVIYYKLFLIN